MSEFSASEQQQNLTQSMCESGRRTIPMDSSEMPPISMAVVLDEGAPDQKVDGFDLCFSCFAKPGPFKCANCHMVSYCSRQCQITDYKKNGHKACCGLLCFPPEKVESMKTGCLMDPSDKKSYSPMLVAETVWVRARAFFNEKRYKNAQQCMNLALTIFEKYARMDCLHIDVIMLAELHRDLGEIITREYPVSSLHADNYTAALGAYNIAREHLETCINTHVATLLPYLNPPVEGKPHFHPDLPIEERIELIERIEECKEDVTELLAAISQGEQYIQGMMM